MGTILITGGAGFIGGHLARAMAAQGHEIHILDNFARGRRDRFLEELLRVPGVQFIERDLLQRDAMAGLGTSYTHIFHLAAIVGVQQVLTRPYPTLRDNIVLLEAMIEFARTQPQLDRFVFASTSEVYAGSLEHMDMPIPTPESTPLALPGLDQPRTSYMLSKIYGEAMVRHSGLPFTILRPHNFYGPRMGMSHVIPQLLEKAWRAADGSTIEVFSVDHRRTFCFIEDAIEIMVRAATLPECRGQVLNAGTEAPEISIGELAATILDVVGKNLEIVAQPATAGSPGRRCPDMSLAAKLTGFRSQVSLRDGVARTYDWYRPMVFEGQETEVAR